MDKPETNAPVSDVLQSDHHAHMSAEEIAKARAHHQKKHGHEKQKASDKKRPGQSMQPPK